MSDKLKPCPFCGGKAKVYWNVWSYEFVKCETCGATTGEFADNKGSIRAWNMRAQPEFTLDELDEIRKALEGRYSTSRKQWEQDLSIIEKCAAALKGGAR